MEYVLANLRPKWRSETLNGREFLVASATLIVPGVLNGSEGALFYPLEEVQKDFHVWNGMPVVLDHPTDGGQFISARQPKVLNSRWLGYVFNTSVNGELTAEAWFDVLSTNQVDPRILPAIKAGKKLELSTGLFMQQEQTPGVHNGVEYKAIARNYVPDHLAILLDSVGACSVKDGCGINNEESEMALNKEQKTELVTLIITNCECWEEGDREALMNLSDEKLETLKKSTEKSKELAEKHKQTEAVANAAREGFNDQQGDNHFFNEETGKWDVKKKTPAANTEQKLDPPTEEEYLKNLPPSVREDVEFARNERKRQKGEIIEKLVGNTKDDAAKTEARKVYETMGLNQLQALAKTLPEKPAEEGSHHSYVGSQGAPVTHGEGGDITKDDYLPIPTLNFEPPKWKTA